jgi:hypothetical protein
MNAGFWRLQTEFKGLFLAVIEFGIEELDVYNRYPGSSRLHPE